MTDRPDPVPRPLSRVQANQNRAFLRALERTGNVREAARSLGLNRSTFTKRRAKHPGFAARWDAALAAAHARLAAGASPAQGTRLLRTASGRVQLRRVTRRRLTREAEQRFLAALSASANVRLSAAAAGFSHSAFYQRANADAGFAREMNLALRIGYDRLEEALIAGTLMEAHEHDAWRHNEPPPIAPMTPNQALQLLYLHQKEARLASNHELLRTRRGEPPEVARLRLSLIAQERERRRLEADRIAFVSARLREDPDWVIPDDMPRPPALDQMTGWSAASGNAPHDETRALFGGWRLKDRRLKDWQG